MGRGGEGDHLEVTFGAAHVADDAFAGLMERGEVTLHREALSAANALMPDVIRLVRETHPAVVLRSREVDVDEALNDLIAGGLDLALVCDYAHAPSPRPHGVERLVVRREPVRLVAPPDEELADVVDLADLAERPFVTGPLDESCGRCLLHGCREAGFEPDVRHVIDSTPAALRLVAGGAGFAVLPDLSLIEPPPGVRFLDLAVPLQRTIELAYRPAAHGRPAVRATIDAIVEVERRADSNLAARLAS